MNVSLRVTAIDGVKVITFDRPAVRNALDEATRQALVEALRDADDDAGIRAVVLTGRDPAFCAGADLKEVLSVGGRVTDPAAAARRLVVPIVAAVNGACMTGGLELALSCDLVIASDRARFADQHVRYGMVASWGLTALLPEAIGVRRAKELSLTGRHVDADEAARIGLVNRVVAHDDLLTEAVEIAREMTAGDASAAAATLRLLDEEFESRVGGGLRREALLKSVRPTDRARVGELWSSPPG